MSSASRRGTCNWPSEVTRSSTSSSEPPSPVVVSCPTSTRSVAIACPSLVLPLAPLFPHHGHLLMLIQTLVTKPNAAAKVAKA